MKKHAFPALEQALAGYLHQDFLIDYANAEEAINAFVSSEPPALVDSARREIGRFIQVVRDSPTPSEELLDLGCYYDPLGDGMGVVAWLEGVERVLSSR